MPSFARELEESLHNALGEASKRRHEYATHEVITFDACSSSISAISRCSSVAYSCRRLLASPRALCSDSSSSRAKLGIGDSSTLNVGGKAAAIKGRTARDCIQPARGGSARLEQLIGGAPVGLGCCKMLFDPNDLGFEQHDPFVELGHRDRPELLFADQGQRIGRR